MVSSGCGKVTRKYCLSAAESYMTMDRSNETVATLPEVVAIPSRHISLTGRVCGDHDLGPQPRFRLIETTDITIDVA